MLDWYPVPHLPLDSVAVEIKGSRRVHEGDIRSLTALLEDGPVKHRVVVCLEPEPRKLSSGIMILPWKNFIERLWHGDFL